MLLQLACGHSADRRDFRSVQRETEDKHGAVFGVDVGRLHSHCGYIEGGRHVYRFRPIGRRNRKGHADVGLLEELYCYAQHVRRDGNQFSHDPLERLHRLIRPGDDREMSSIRGQIETSVNDIEIQPLDAEVLHVDDEARLQYRLTAQRDAQHCKGPVRLHFNRQRREFCFRSFLPSQGKLHIEAG